MFYVSGAGSLIWSVRRRPHGREGETPLSCRGKIFDRLSSLIGADQISEDKRRLVVHRFDHEGRGFLFVYFEWFAATFPSAAVWRPSRREEAFWPEIFEIVSARRRTMALHRRLRFGPGPWSFGFFMSQGSAVGGR